MLGPGDHANALGTRGSALALEGEATLIRGKYGVWGVPIGNYSLLSTHYSLIYGVWGLLSVQRRRHLKRRSTLSSLTSPTHNGSVKGLISCFRG